MLIGNPKRYLRWYSYRWNINQINSFTNSKIEDHCHIIRTITIWGNNKRKHWSSIDVLRYWNKSFPFFKDIWEYIGFGLLYFWKWSKHEHRNKINNLYGTCSIEEDQANIDGWSNFLRWFKDRWTNIKSDSWMF